MKIWIMGGCNGTSVIIELGKDYIKLLTDLKMKHEMESFYVWPCSGFDVTIRSNELPKLPSSEISLPSLMTRSPTLAPITPETRVGNTKKPVHNNLIIVGALGVIAFLIVVIIILKFSNLSCRSAQPTQENVEMNNL